MKKTLMPLLALTLLFISCDKDDLDGELILNISGLENLGNSAIYEGWITGKGPAKTTGTFSVDDNGEMSETSFRLDSDDLASADAFVLTIEPLPDPTTDPSSVHIIAGDFSGNSASLSIGHGSALGNNFSSSAGNYILATPTDGADNNENSGIWFLDVTSGAPMAGLSLPTLPSGWKYEGWAVINGTPVTTGTFLSASGADDSAPFSGTQGGPAFPGEDFVTNAPSGLTFPTDLSGGMAVISIEPNPDNSPNPFTLKPLASMIPADANDHQTYSIEQNLGSFPTGTATR